MMKYVVKGFDLEGRIKDLPTRFRRGGESRFFLGMELAVSKEAVLQGLDCRCSWMQSAPYRRVCSGFC